MPPVVPGRVAHPQPDGVPGGPAQGPAGDRGPHDTAAQLLHQAEGRQETGRLHHGETGRDTTLRGHGPSLASGDSTVTCSTLWAGVISSVNLSVMT